MRFFTITRVLKYASVKRHSGRMNCSKLEICCLFGARLLLELNIFTQPPLHPSSHTAHTSPGQTYCVEFFFFLLSLYASLRCQTLIGVVVLNIFHIFSPPGEMIQFNWHIFFRWVYVEPPPTIVIDWQSPMRYPNSSSSFGWQGYVGTP